MGVGGRGSRLRDGLGGMGVGEGGGERGWYKEETGVRGGGERETVGLGRMAHFFLSSECHASAILFFVIGLAVFASGKFDCA